MGGAGPKPGAEQPFWMGNSATNSTPNEKTAEKSSAKTETVKKAVAEAKKAAEAKAADGENTAEQPKKKKGFMDKVKEAFEDIDK